MRFVNDSYSFLGDVPSTLTANGGDLTGDNHNFSVANAIPAFPTVNYGFIASTPQFSSTWKASIAEVLQITTLTPTQATAVGQVYQFTIVQNVEGQGIKSQTFKYTSLTSTDSTTTICNAFRNQLLGYNTVQVAFTGTTTLIITALTRSPIFVVYIQQTGAGLTQNTGTAGLHSYGTVPDFVAQGITGYVAGHTYKTLEIKYLSDDSTEAANVASSMNRARLFVNEAAVNFSDFNTRMIQIGEDLTAGAAADHELVEIFGALGS